MISSQSNSDPVELLAEEFLERCRRGEHPSVAEYVARYPELAARIEAFFPALLLLENLKVEPGASSEGSSEPALARGGDPERIGEYRIIRRIGRGGMGIVYEAEQESLGRRVAIKVLLSPSLTHSHRLARFHREARLAARLHHTNIVPVFGVGLENGVHYHVMQLISGPGLDQVIEELPYIDGFNHRLQLTGLSSPLDRNPAASEVARTLFLQTSSEPIQIPEIASEPSNATPESRPGITSATPSSSSSESRRQYAQNVARIGEQIADALSHAHRQGILHRDIKPSNLLLDTLGNAWLTDFGLAKLEGHDDLTATGDVVGTLRYMAPE